MNGRAGVYRYIACAALLSCSTTPAMAEDDGLASVSCDKFQRAHDVVRVNEDTAVVDLNWEGYSLRAGQTIAESSAAARERRLFRMIVAECTF